MEKYKHIIYQTFPRLFGNYTEIPIRNGTMEINGCGKFNSYTTKALTGIKDLGVTHIWYTGILAHATCTDYSDYGITEDPHFLVKGKAGSPYAVKDYYDVDPDLAENIPERLSEFEELIKRTHNAGMKVIIDFVPNHVSRNYCSLLKPSYIDDLGQCDRPELAFCPSNNFYYLPGQSFELNFRTQKENCEYQEFPAKATGNDCFNAHPGINDWYETVKLNYGVDYLNRSAQFFIPVPDTWHKMLHILLYWVEKDVDGFRCDMAEMVPVQFWNWVIPHVKQLKNVMFIAEIYNPSMYRNYLQTGHFDYLYDKVGMYDILRSIICRNTSVNCLNQYLQMNEDIHDHLLFFMENHDEQRIASDYFAGNMQAGIPAMIFLATYQTNPIMIYNGQELGEKGMDNEGFSGYDGKTSIFDYWRMESIRRWANNGCFDGGLLNNKQRQLRTFYKKILRLTNDEKALSMGSFYNLSYCNDDNPMFPSDRMSAYLRKYENELILVCINFDNQSHSFQVKIAIHAFETLHIPDNTVAITKELLSGEESISSLTYTCPFQGTIPGYSAILLKFIY